MVLCVFWPHLFCSDFLFFTGAYKPPPFLSVNDVKIHSGDFLNRISMPRLGFIFSSTGRGQKFFTTGNVAAGISSFVLQSNFSPPCLMLLYHSEKKSFNSRGIGNTKERRPAWAGWTRVCHLSWIWESDSAEHRNCNQTSLNLASVPAIALLWFRLSLREIEYCMFVRLTGEQIQPMRTSWNCTTLVCCVKMCVNRENKLHHQEFVLSVQ